LCDDRQVERARCCGELGIDRRQCDALPLCECLDLAPSFRDPFVEWKEPACETDAQIVIEEIDDSYHVILLVVSRFRVRSSEGNWLWRLDSNQGPPD
jgi:hypothetical protein